MVGVTGVIRQWEKNSWGALAGDAVFLPQVLKKQGYHTTIIGKWHLGFEEHKTPNAIGFDYFKGFLGVMMDDYWDYKLGGVNWMQFNDQEINPEGHAAEKEHICISGRILWQ